MTLTPPPDIGGGNPMQLDSARAAAKAAARAFCEANNLCFYCRKPGHMVAECNEKKAADARFPQRMPTGHFRGRGGYMQGRGGYKPPPYVQPRNHHETPLNQLRLLNHGPTDEETASITSGTPTEMTYPE
jgi:hypothetical protein